MPAGNAAPGDHGGESEGAVNSPDKMLCEELDKVIHAGDKLAEAAHYVQANYDGIHRLRLALAKWYQTRADEHGRK